MMNRSLVALVVGVSCSSALAIAACSGSSGDDSSIISSDATFADTSSADDSGNPIPDSGGPIDTGAPIDSGTPTPDSGSCADLSDGGCFRCCSADDPDAAAVIEESALACACTTPGDCKTECADTLCKRPKQAAPDAKCDKCLAQTDAGGCFAKAKTTACGSSTSCDDVAACFATCPN
jgi:hypothetical protein